MLSILLGSFLLLDHSIYQHEDIPDLEKGPVPQESCPVTKGPSSYPVRPQKGQVLTLSGHKRAKLLPCGGDAIGNETHSS